MGWIVQQYEGEVHIVPDTEPDHVLASDCFCKPVQKDPDLPEKWTHNDLLDRTALL